MRWLTDGEKPATRALWQEMFWEDSPSFVDYYYREKAPEADISAEEAAEEVVSMIQWNPYPLWVRGQRWDSRYLVGVATRPAYRHRGLMARQLQEGMAHWRRQRMPFVWLMPADPAIYRPFGFRYVYRKWTGRLPEGAGAAVPGADGGSREEAAPDAREALAVRPLQPEEDAWAAAFCMGELSRRFRVFPERNRDYLARLRREVASEGGGLAVLEQERTPVGVMAFWPEEEGLEVRELILAESFLPDGQRLGLPETPAFCRRRQAVQAAVRAYLARQYPESGASCPAAVVNTGWLGEARPAIMARIVHLEAFLEAICSRENRSLVLQVQDPLLPENSGTFRWYLSPQGSRLEAAPGAVPELSLGVEELTEWLLGSGARAGYEAVQTLGGGFFAEIV